VGVEVDDVEAHVAGPRTTEHGVGVGAVVVEQPAGLVHELRHLDDVGLEQTKRVGIGEHEAGDVAGVVGHKGADGGEVDAAAGVAGQRRRPVAGHHHRRRVGAVAVSGMSTRCGSLPRSSW